MFLATILIPIALILLISLYIDRRRRKRNSFYPELHVSEDAEGRTSPDLLANFHGPKR